MGFGDLEKRRIYFLESECLAQMEAASPDFSSGI
jgi:hypothetical protein